MPGAAVEGGDEVGRRIAVRVLEGARRVDVGAVVGQPVDEGGSREPAVGAGVFAPDGAPVPSRSSGRRGRPGDARHVGGIGAHVDVGPDRGQAANEIRHRARAASPARAHRVPARPIPVGDVVGGGLALQVGEPAARVEGPVAVGGERVDGPGELVCGVDDGGAGGAGVEVAGENAVGGGDAGAVGEGAGDVEGPADDLQRRRRSR